MDMTTGVGLLFTAGILGFAHGIEPDHVAGITALTHEAGNAKLSALVGGCFALGHAVLVIAWIVLAHLLFGATSLPPQFEQLGLLSVGIILVLLSLYLGFTGTRNLLHKHRHSHGGGSHTHFHKHLSDSGHPDGDDHGDHDHSEQSHGHGHGVTEYLKVGTVGAMFTLSPPVSMIAFITVAMTDGGGTVAVGVVTAYTVSIVAAMATIGGGAGLLFQFSKDKNERFYASLQIVAAVLVLAFAIYHLASVLPNLSI